MYIYIYMTQDISKTSKSLSCVFRVDIVFRPASLPPSLPTSLAPSFLPPSLQSPVPQSWGSSLRNLDTKNLHGLTKSDGHPVWLSH